MITILLDCLTLPQPSIKKKTLSLKYLLLIIAKTIGTEYAYYRPSLFLPVLAEAEVIELI